MPLPPTAEARLNELNIVRAVRGTTGIEGASLSTDEVEQIRKHPGERVLTPRREREEKEARNANAVMEFVAGDSDQLITEQLIVTIHRLTTQGIDYENNSPGMYRSHPAAVDGYRPPSTNDEIRALMAQFVEWINTGERRYWDPIIRAIVSHFYVVSIHPFGDGNGRTSRGVEAFVLYRSGLNVRGFYSLANYYYENRSRYFEMLDHVRFNTGGDLTPFVLFALQGFETELEWVRNQVVEASKWTAFRDYARELIFGPEGPETDSVALRLFKLAVAIPHEGIPLADLRLRAPAMVPGYRRVGDRTISRDIAKLEDMGLIVDDDEMIRPNLAAIDHLTRAAGSVPA